MWGKEILPVLYLFSFISIASFLIRPSISQNVFDKPGGHKHSKHFGEEGEKNIVFQMPSLIYKDGKWEPIPDEDKTFNSNENNENNEDNQEGKSSSFPQKSASGSIFDDRGSDYGNNDDSQEESDNHSENPNENTREFIMNGSSPFNYVRRLLTRNVTIGEPLTWTFSKKRPRRDAKGSVGTATTARSTGSRSSDGDPHKFQFIYGEGSRSEKEGKPNPKGIDEAPNMNSNKTRSAAEENHRRTEDAAG